MKRPQSRNTNPGKSPPPGRGRLKRSRSAAFPKIKKPNPAIAAQPARERLDSSNAAKAQPIARISTYPAPNRTRVPRRSRRHRARQWFMCHSPLSGASCRRRERTSREASDESGSPRSDHRGSQAAARLSASRSGVAPHTSVKQCGRIIVMPIAARTLSTSYAASALRLSRGRVPVVTSRRFDDFPLPAEHLLELDRRLA